MHDQNVEIVRSVIAALNDRDYDAIVPLIADDAVFDWSRRLLDPTVDRGLEGALRFVDTAFEIFEEVRIEEEEAIATGDRVVFVSVARFRGRESGAEVEARAAPVWTVRGGKVVHMEFHQDKASAMEAVGLTDVPDEG